MNSQPGILGRKVGMTQFFADDGKVVPCTVVEAGPCTVLQIRNEETDGYNAIQLGFDTAKAANKPMQGHLAKAEATPKQFIREIRLDAGTAAGYTAGQEVNIGDLFQEGARVDVTGNSKGKGTAGVMKKYNFRGFIRSHGTHEFFRHGGSIGTRLTPGMVAKGTKMPSRMGNEQVTLQNLTIAKIDTDRNLLFIKGGIPGANGGYVVVRSAVKHAG
jgi:large subunit ribosomal protein L3